MKGKIRARCASRDPAQAGSRPPACDKRGRGGGSQTAEDSRSSDEKQRAFVSVRTFRTIQESFVFLWIVLLACEAHLSRPVCLPGFQIIVARRCSSTSLNRERFLLYTAEMVKVQKISFVLLVALFVLSGCCNYVRDDDPTVYITNTESKYHRFSCSYLSQSKISISLSSAIAQGYTPCSRCDPPR